MYVPCLLVAFMLGCGMKSYAADCEDVMGVTLNWLRSGLSVCGEPNPSVIKRVGLDSSPSSAPKCVTLLRACGVDFSRIKLLPKTPLLIRSSRVKCLQLDLRVVPAFDSESDDELLLLNEKYREG